MADTLINLDDPQHRIADTDTVHAVALLTEALELADRARGALYEAHHSLEEADRRFAAAAHALRTSGHAIEAALVEDQLVGRDLLPGRWSFEVVEEFDDGYWLVARTIEREVRTSLVAGCRHLAAVERKAAVRVRRAAGLFATHVS